MTRHNISKSLAVLLRARMQPNPISSPPPPPPPPQPTPLPPPTDPDPAAPPVALVRHWLHASASAASPPPAALDGFSDGYRSLDLVGRREVLRSLAIDYDVPRARVRDLMRQYMSVASAEPSGGDDVEAEGKEGAASALYRMERGLRDALRPRYAGFLEAMNAQPGGLKLLAVLRADLLAMLGEENAPALRALDSYLKEKLVTWLRTAALTLHQITWDDPASLLEKIVAYEAVHPIRNLMDLKRRLGIGRRCFGYFHPAIPGEPLIFIEVALLKDMAASIQEVLWDDPPTPESEASCALFYSISSTQPGLSGINLGKFLLKRVIDMLRRDMPSVQIFATLSPIPGFMQWLLAKLASQIKLSEAESQEGNSLGACSTFKESILLPDEERMIHDAIEKADGKQGIELLQDILKSRQWVKSGKLSSALKPPLMRLCARYLAREKKRGKALDAVANFHLQNGAMIERINWMADQSEKGIQQSGGIMVNYLYRLENIEEYALSYSSTGLIHSSPSLSEYLEVSRAVAEEKRVVFTGHSSGGSIATLAAIWFLEKCTRRGSVNQAHPFCVTFGAPLIGDNIFNHAVKREGWSQCILHFLLPLDIVPHIPLTPLASFREEIQAVLDWFSPQTPNNSPAARSLVIPGYYETLLRSILSIASYEACSFMGCTSSILGTLTSFIDLSPYRPCGTYHFLTSSEQLIVLTNSDAVLQLLFYCLQLDPQQQLLDATARSLSAHWQYEPIKECMQDIICVDYLGTISSTVPGRQTDRVAIGSIELSREAMLHLSAAAQWEKQRQRNQTKIDESCQKIQEALGSLNEYKSSRELRGVSYYDSFKLQREVHDFNANVRRLELAGLWDEIVEMLRRRELPDGFEAREEWVSLGTLFRRLVEPLDIANYYRHSKNEDTGSYLSKGRPRRYKYTQKWHEQLQRAPVGSSLESCFWAVVEELQAEMADGRAFEDLRDRVVKLENDAHGWYNSGSLGKDVFLGSSSFVAWWRTLPEQHRSASSIAKLVSL